MSTVEIISIQDMKLEDVLIERGGERNYSHLIGMIAFKAMVESRLETYTSAASKSEKTRLTYKVLESVTASGGRFVVRNDGKGGSQELRVLDKAEARRKARDCFRDCIKNARRGVSRRPSALLDTIGLPREMFGKRDTYANILHRVATNPRVKLFMQTRGSSAEEASRDKAITPAAIRAQASFSYSPPEAMSETGAAAPDVRPALPLKMCRGERDTHANTLHRVATNQRRVKRFLHTIRGSVATEASRHMAITPAALCAQAATGPSLEMSSGERDTYDDTLHRAATNQQRVKRFLHATRGSAATETSNHMAIAPVALCATMAPGIGLSLPIEMFSGERYSYTDMLHRVANDQRVKQFLQTRASTMTEASRHMAIRPAVVCAQSPTGFSYRYSLPTASKVTSGGGPADLALSSDIVAPDSTVSRSRALVASVSIYCKGAEE